MSGQEFYGIGFTLSNGLKVFSAYEAGMLKMVGVNQNGDQEARFTNKRKGVITFDDVNGAWESPTGNAGTDYRVKDISSSCDPGIVML